MEEGDLYCPQSTPVKLFVGQIPRLWKEENVAHFFARFSKVTDAQIIRDSQGSHRGCAFVTFMSMTDADVVIDALNENFYLPGSSSKFQLKWAEGEARRLGIAGDPAHATKILALNVPDGIPDDALLDLFSNYGRLRVFQVVRDALGVRCYIKYTTKEQSLYAVKELHGKRFLPETKPVELHFAESFCRFGSPGGSEAVSQGPAIFYEFRTAENVPYYFNMETKETQWKRPSGGNVEVRTEEDYRRDQAAQEGGSWTVVLRQLSTRFTEEAFSRLLETHAPITAYLSEEGEGVVAVASFENEAAARSFYDHVARLSFTDEPDLWAEVLPAQQDSATA